MTCPHCLSPVQSSSPLCAGCGFGLPLVDGVLGDIRVSLEPLIVEQDFPFAEAESIRSSIQEFSADFPQIYLSVYLGPVMGGGPLPPFAFWLLNHGEAESADGQPWDQLYFLLMVIDPTQREATVAAGYAVEQFLSEADGNAALDLAKPYFAAGQWSTGVRAAIEMLHESLVQATLASTQTGGRA